jgi:hypothetical protein
MANLSLETFKKLCEPGTRLPWLRDWLLSQVWTTSRYESLSPVDFLKQGEREVNEVEEVIAEAAPRLYGELLGNVPPERDVRTFLERQRPCAVVVFDGLSLREVPLLLRLASKSRLKLVEPANVTFAAVPSETIDFVRQRLGIGNVAPSDLPRRQTLREAGIAAYYYDAPSRQFSLDPTAEALLLWSSFPDITYKDSGARFAQHFEHIHAQLETAWMNTVQRIPQGRKILVTSDHGYVYFDAGMNFPRPDSAVRPLTQYFGGERSKSISAAGSPPSHPDLITLQSHDVAIIRGRVQTHPPGPSSNKLYKHGGLSLMEMLTPWIVLTSDIQ